MIIRIPHTKFDILDVEVINNKLVVNKVYGKWSTSYKGYDLWKYANQFAIYHKDNKYIGIGYKSSNQDELIEIEFSKKPNINIIAEEVPVGTRWYISDAPTYNYDKINTAFTNNNYYKVMTDTEKFEADKLKAENWNKATCSVCHRLIQLNSDSIWDHGYTMVGFRNGICSGADYKSWEKSPQGKIDFIKSIKHHIENNTKITLNEIKFYNNEIEINQKKVDEWKISLTPKELQDKVAQ